MNQTAAGNDPYAARGQDSVAAQGGVVDHPRDWVEPFLVNAYHLRMFNALREHFEQRLDRATLCLVYWLEHLASGADRALSQAAREELATIDPALAKGQEQLSLRVLGGALEIPRETLRRTQTDLLDGDWLVAAEPRGLRAAPRLLAFAQSFLDTERLRDFLWTAGALEDFRSRRALGPGGVRVIEGVIRATRTRDMPGSLGSPVTLPPPGSPAARRVAIALGAYSLRHAVATRVAFHGDLLLPLVLGEVAHYSHSRVVTSLPAATWAELERHVWNADAVASARADGRLRSCSAHSLALSMEIAPETMRRKLMELRELGWATRDEDGAYWPGVGLASVFASFNRVRFRDFSDTAERLKAMLAAS